MISLLTLQITELLDQDVFSEFLSQRNKHLAVLHEFKIHISLHNESCKQLTCTLVKPSRLERRSLAPSCHVMQ